LVLKLREFSSLGGKFFCLKSKLAKNREFNRKIQSLISNCHKTQHQDPNYGPIFVQFVNYSSSDFGKCSEQTDIGLFDLHLMISYSVNIRLFNIA